MNGYRFYAEYESAAKKRGGTRKALGEHMGNVVALSTTSEAYTSGRDVMQEGFSAVYGWGNSAVNWGAHSRSFLAAKCRRISETQAREIHPVLFERLDCDETPAQKFKGPVVGKRGNK